MSLFKLYDILFRYEEDNMDNIEKFNLICIIYGLKILEKYNLLNKFNI